MLIGGVLTDLLTGNSFQTSLLPILNNPGPVPGYEAHSHNACCTICTVCTLGLHFGLVILRLRGFAGLMEGNLRIRWVGGIGKGVYCLPIISLGVSGKIYELATL